MPELPEVQTTTEGLKKILPGLTIEDLWSDMHKDSRSKSLENIKNPQFLKKFKKKVKGQKISEVRRFGKNIVIDLFDGPSILIHMKMTGHLLYGKHKKEKGTWVPAISGTPLSDPFNRFIHFILIFSNGKHLAFSDARKFGKITLIEKTPEGDYPYLKQIGPDPLERKINKKEFKKILNQKNNWSIKAALLDQSLISGIGNIYADESLWTSKINPETRIKKIEEQKIEELFGNIKKIMKKSINLGGDSDSDYRNIFGQKGEYQKHHKVYRKEKENCPRKECHGIIFKTIVAGRGTRFCSNCQPKE